MRFAIRIAALLIVALASYAETAKSSCWYDDVNSNARFGKDEQGYFIEVAAPPHHPQFGPGGSIESLVDYFAAQASATVYYGASATRRAMGPGTFRSADPLTAFRAFVRAGGLDVAVVKDKLWILHDSDEPWSTPFSIILYPFDSSQKRWLDPQEGGTFAEDLVRQLPVRSEPMQLNDGSLRNDVGYYWLPGEQDALVVAMFGFHEQMKPAAVFRVMKVRATREGAGYGFECLWTARLQGGSTAAGPLLYGINEDFDGDGYADLVFSTFDVDYHHPQILSGKDGHTLGSFVDLWFGVDKRTSGAKYFVEGSYDRPGPGGLEVFSEELKRYTAMDQDSAATMAAHATATGSSQPAESVSAAPMDLLARIVGGPANVRVYALPGADLVTSNRMEKLGFDVVKVPTANWTMGDMESIRRKGTPLRVVIEYKPERSGTPGAESPPGSLPDRQ